ncbi:O-antigen ligase family protein, partial [bacterium]|nr:O-antigen ligase family protein [bacterium]
MDSMDLRLNTEPLRKGMNLFILLFVAGSVFSIAVTQMALTLAVLFWIMIMLREKNFLVRRSSLDYYFLAFAVIGFVSLVFCPDKGSVVNFLKRILLITIVYLLAGNLSEKRLIKTLLVTLSGTMILLAVFGIWKYLAGIGGLSGRLKLFHHYMTSGGILMIVALITFAFLLVKAPRRVRIAALAAVGLMLLPLIFTFTRSSWLGLIAGMIFMSVLQNRKVLIGIGILVAAFWLLATGSMKDRAASAFDPSHPRNTERVYMWKAGAEMIKDNPVTGVGDIDLTKLYNEYKPPQAIESPGHLHNNFIMFGVIWGIPGLLIFLILFGKILLTEIRVFISVPQEEWLLKGVALGALGTFTGFHVAGLFEWNFGDAEIVMLFWMTVGFS